ncbi:transposase [Vibrio crassostreae]|nr:transposase [Vibrio crassostreae]
MLQNTQSVSILLGVLKGLTAILIFNKFPHIRKKLWGKHFWARGYFVDTVGVNEEVIHDMYGTKTSRTESLSKNCSYEELIARPLLRRFSK